GNGAVPAWGRAKASPRHHPAGDCPQPPRFAFAEPPTPLNESYAVGTVLRYRCRPGYTMAGGKSPRVTCLTTSQWASDPDFCIGGFPPRGLLGFGGGEGGASPAAPQTPPWFSTAEDAPRMSVSYSMEMFLCFLLLLSHAVIPCLPPPGIENGQLLNGDRDFTFGMAVTYSCDKDFSLIGDATIHCTVDENLEGTWSGPAPECKMVRCKNPEVKNGKRLSGFGTEHTYKHTVTFECNPGHLLRGSSVVTCEADSTWKPPLPTCDPIYCGPAPRFPFAEGERAVGDSSLAGTVLRYRCKPGYTAARGKSSDVTCLSNATWSADPDFCIRQQCTPLTIKNGDVIAENFLFETVVTFSCHPGYELKESSSAKCVVSGNGVDWDTASPSCENVMCSRPPNIANGLHSGQSLDKFSRGVTMYYSCKDGYKLVGNMSISCTEAGVWSRPLPRCEGG
ncbi:C4BPA protein, partial [Nyctibius bracteatus]|nr:C4BPA protein [Nyctibius bracteatus]